MAPRTRSQASKAQSDHKAPLIDPTLCGLPTELKRRMLECIAEERDLASLRAVMALTAVSKAWRAEATKEAMCALPLVELVRYKDELQIEAVVSAALPFAAAFCSCIVFEAPAPHDEELSAKASRALRSCRSWSGKLAVKVYDQGAVQGILDGLKSLKDSPGQLSIASKGYHQLTYNEAAIQATFANRSLSVLTLSNMRLSAADYLHDRSSLLDTLCSCTGLKALRLSRCTTRPLQTSQQASFLSLRYLWFSNSLYGAEAKELLEETLLRAAPCLKMLHIDGPPIEAVVTALACCRSLEVLSMGRQAWQTRAAINALRGCKAPSLSLCFPDQIESAEFTQFLDDFSALLARNPTYWPHMQYLMMPLCPNPSVIGSDELSSVGIREPSGGCNNDLAEPDLGLARRFYRFSLLEGDLGI